MNWSFLDFIVAAVLLLGTGLMFEFLLRKVKTIKFKIAISATLLILFFLIWAKLAVGIIGILLGGDKT